MRIVAGAARGRRLRAPGGPGTRPTADRVKEALFSSLQPLLPSAVVLDLYAGSGALGLEALSRGAARVTFVESDRRALAALRHNIEVVALAGAEVVAGDVERSLATPLPGAPFDLVLLDPPYAVSAERLGKVLARLVPQLASGATVVIERAARDGAPPWPPDLLEPTSRRYGDTAVHRARAGDDPARSAKEST
jgi:16S rRNA (guanine966-N2)-methyltransferase